ncbi:MAG: hypothetical protein JJT90_16525 [Ectothiorhodospiraceae bacterium]|nr:hypothetical protein [Ectothiorhodospiraceae bacterium]
MLPWGGVFAYRMVVGTIEPAGFQHLVKALLRKSEILEFRISLMAD